jgi:ABC-type transport system involved in multi-copper enzyme maturation permease subunit
LNRSQLRALAADAFHQVLDNGVFRVLTVLCALPVLFTFLVGFREEGVVVLFGLKSWSYAELLSGFGESVLPPDPRGLVIEAVLQVVLQFLAGSLGMLVALAATAFFVPRMLEKGAAELYFHKPVSRTVLFLSRYFAGVLFVALTSFLLVAGMYLGLLLVSGHGDAGILMAALTLTYSFAAIYAFTLLCGVVTRSTMASLLLSAFFFLFNGCIHNGWIEWQQATKGPTMRMLRAERERENEGTEAADEDADDEAGEETDEEGDSGTAEALLGTLDTLHLLLPKTTDADYLGQKLRAALDPPYFREESTYLTLARLPEGLETRTTAELATHPLREALGEPLLAAGDAGARHSLWRRPAVKSETRIGERVRERTESASQAAKALEKALEARPEVSGVELAAKSERLGEEQHRASLTSWRVTWSEGEAGARRTRLAHVFKGLDDDTVYTVLVEAEAELAPETAAETGLRLAGGLYIDQAAAGQWYLHQLGLRAPLRFNILFSIGSTLLFAALALALGAWRLSRMEL